MASARRALGWRCASTTPDENTIMDHADFDCLRWKEILSLIDDYYKVNYFLVEKNVLISLNYILPKAMYYVVFRNVIFQGITNRRRGRIAIERQVEIKSTRARASNGTLGPPMT
jgi:hypothetical protein